MEIIQINDIVELKKEHPCKERSRKFKVIGFDGEVRLKCSTCGGIILLKKAAFFKAFKQKVN